MCGYFTSGCVAGTVGLASGTGLVVLNKEKNDKNETKKDIIELEKKCDETKEVISPFKIEMKQTLVDYSSMK
jgi:hypothetical protein